MSDDDPTQRYRPATLAANFPGVEAPDGGVVPPWQPATTYVRGGNQEFTYLRDDGPVIATAEAQLAALEGAVDALLFASGMAAADAVFRTLPPGAHVVVPDVMYWALNAWVKDQGESGHLRVSSVDGADLDAIAAAVRPGETGLVWIETPANPLWTVTDIAGAAEIAHAAGARLAVDSTVATPVLTRPLELGADIVMHSATKYLNGHSDVLAGALASARDDDFWQRVRKVRTLGGAIIGSFEAWLLMRGMRTLSIRVERAAANAIALAGWLTTQPAVSHVLYPGLADHPGHDTAARQMQGGFGAMMSIRLKGGFDAAAKVAATTKLFREATSLGGVESLIEHRAPVEGPQSPCPDDLLRLSVGIEDIEDLKADLAAALAAV